MTPEFVYIVVALMLVSTTLSVIFFMAFKSMGERPYALSWAFTYLAATFQWLFILRSDWFPGLKTHWLAVSALALVSITLGLRGHCQRTNSQTLPDNLWPLAGLVFAAVVWTTVVNPHVGVRVALISIAACGSLLFAAVIVFRHREHPRPAELAVATTLMLSAISQGIVAAMALMQGAEGDSVYQTLYMRFNFLSLPAAYVAVGLFVVFMLASDISFEMKELAIRDQLTGVLNRRGLGERGAQAYATSKRTGWPVSVVMMDIDRFKNINDKYGHAFGDAALVHFSELLVENCRTNDVLARVGGEEFALVLPGTKLEDAMRLADDLCRKIDSHEMHVGDIRIRMTASFGVASVSIHDTGLSDTVARADRALYRSKHAGRNMVDLESSQLMLAADGTLKPIRD